MVNNPDGTIITQAPAIQALGLGDYYGYGHITMYLQFKDTEYKRAQNGIGGYYGISPGVFQYYCPTNKFKGSITVLERPEVIRERKRQLASEGVKVWMPREE